MLHKSASYSLLSSDGLQTRWRASAATNFIRRKNRFKFHYVYILATVLLVLIVYISLPSKRNHLSSYTESVNLNSVNHISYNSTYPLTRPIVNPHSHHTIYKIGIIADLDTSSKSKSSTSWNSYLKLGFLTVGPSPSFDFKWDTTEAVEITSGYSLKGRGMELSEIVTFNGRLLTFDDRTGIVFEIINSNMVAPWVILSDGNPISGKGFKSEWATVKNSQLYIGSMGKEWTNAAGVFENNNPMMVKVVSMTGEVKTLDWVTNYKALRKALDIEWPGYLIHESGAWSDANKKWFFLPRRCSKERYNETLDEVRGCNYLITADESFASIETVKIGELKPSRGYSSFKFLPGSHDSIIVALKTEELNGSTSTYVSVFDINGKVFVDDEKIQTTFKYEGFEFI